MRRLAQAFQSQPSALGHVGKQIREESCGIVRILKILKVQEARPYLSKCHSTSLVPSLAKRERNREREVIKRLLVEEY